MIINKRNVLILLATITVVGLVMVTTMGGKDSEKNQLSRRLNAFVASLPSDVRTAFRAGQYDQVKTMLQSKLEEYYALVSRQPRDQALMMMKAEFSRLPPAVRDSVPTEMRKFYTAYYAVLDFECIQGFSPAEVVDFFRQYFVNRLREIRGR